MDTNLVYTNMLGVRLTVPAEGIITNIERTREAGRLAEYGWHADVGGPIPGGCSWMSEWAFSTYGWARTGGCYVTPEGHIAHYWNVLPDGRIIDGTADQFRDGSSVRITAADDPRYDSTCDGDDAPGHVYIG